MGLLKDLYSENFYRKLAHNLGDTLDGFDSDLFINDIYTPAFQQMELKQRMRHTTVVLHRFLSATYPGAVDDLLKLISQLRKNNFGEDHLAMMFLPDYIEHYGLDDYETSVKALEIVTQFVSCEFAVRPFLQKYFDEMMIQMQKWSQHENAKVRRLATEGSRPALPWGLAVPILKKDPSRILPILENLHGDPSESVRRSVANNLNDISKNHPEVVLLLIARWKGLSKETDAIIKHGSRTLLKQGHAEILAHYNLESKHLELLAFEILTPVVKIGDGLEFTFTVCNADSVKQTVRLEYALYYKRLNGQVSKKVFKISEREYEAGYVAMVKRSQSFRIITTRVYYSGVHQLSIILNGEESQPKNFELLDA